VTPGKMASLVVKPTRNIGVWSVDAYIAQKWCAGMSESISVTNTTMVISIVDLFAVSLAKSIKDVAGMEALAGVMLTKRSEIRLHEKRRMYMLKTVEGRNEVQ
jgi:hypothetical protein